MGLEEESWGSDVEQSGQSGWEICPELFLSVRLSPLGYGLMVQLFIALPLSFLFYLPSAQRLLSLKCFGGGSNLQPPSVGMHIPEADRPIRDDYKSSI